MESAPVENVLASSQRFRRHRSEGMSIVRSVRVAATEQPYFESTVVARHKIPIEVICLELATYFKYGIIHRICRRGSVVEQLFRKQQVVRSIRIVGLSILG